MYFRTPRLIFCIRGSFVILHALSVLFDVCCDIELMMDGSRCLFFNVYDKNMIVYVITAKKKSCFYHTINLNNCICNHGIKLTLILSIKCFV